MRDVVIIGVGMTRFGRFNDKSYAVLGRDAALVALKDCAVGWQEIQAVYAGSMFAGAEWGNVIVHQLGRTGVPIFNIENACATGGAVFTLAYQAVAGSIYDIVLAVGAEKQPRGLISLPGLPLWRRRMGLAAGAAYHAMEAQRYMYQYGLTLEQLAKIGVKSHKNASLCPYAHYQNMAGLTVADVLADEMVSDPLTRYLLAPTSEGGAAAIVCAKEVAHKYTDRRGIKVAACVHTSGPYDKYGLQIMEPSIAGYASRQAYNLAGIGPEDINIVEVEDAGAGSELWKYQELQFCKEGEAGKLLDEGQTEITGRIPVNTDGGHLSRGNPMGAAALAELTEVVTQLRGEAMQRQVEGAKIGLVEAFGKGPNETVIILQN